MYVYLPVVEKIEGNLYYFNCSYEAILHYFKRFGNEAIIISPKVLYRRMMSFYFIASRAYRYFGKDKKEQIPEIKILKPNDEES
ncbi:MAG: hypothetical protein ACOX3K_04085 [Bacilli bacterium]